MRDIFIFWILVTACGEPVKVVEVKSNLKTETVERQKKIKYNDPIFFMGTGTSFGLYFQELFKLGRYSEMLDFTSVQSIKKYGKERLLKYYSEELKFGYTLGKLTSTNKMNDRITLNYANSILFASRRVSRFNIVIEADSCKVLLNTLKSNPF